MKKKELKDKIDKLYSEIVNLKSELYQKKNELQKWQEAAIQAQNKNATFVNKITEWFKEEERKSKKVNCVDVLDKYGHTPVKPDFTPPRMDQEYYDATETK